MTNWIIWIASIEISKLSWNTTDLKITEPDSRNFSGWNSGKYYQGNLSRFQWRILYWLNLLSVNNIVPWKIPRWNAVALFLGWCQRRGAGKQRWEKASIWCNEYSEIHVLELRIPSSGYCFCSAHTCEDRLHWSRKCKAGRTAKGQIKGVYKYQVQ